MSKPHGQRPLQSLYGDFLTPSHQPGDHIVRVCLSRLWGFVALGLVFISNPSFAASDACGNTPREALAAAERSLHSDATDSQHRALECLLRATQLLADAQTKLDTGNEREPGIQVPLAGGLNQPVKRQQR
jgi:hypothetical protein